MYRFLLAFILILVSTSALSQKLNLEIVLYKNKRDTLIKEVKYQTTFSKYDSIPAQILLYTEKLKKLGYFTSTIDSITKTNNLDYKAHINLGRRISHLKIQEVDINSKFINQTIPIENWDTFLNKNIKTLEKKGKVFSEVKYKPEKINNDTLVISIDIKESKTRKIDKVIIQGYSEFPKSFINNNLNITKSTVFNANLLQSIEENLNKLAFVEATKQPEVLFKQDSTILYLGLKRKNNNSLDGLVNFTTDENGKFLLTGNIDIKLNNLFNYGEKISLFWNRAGNNRQELIIASSLPYLFKSRLSPEIKFEMFRQDSTFSNTKFSSFINYEISPSVKLGASINTENSSSIENSTNKPFSNVFGGVNASIQKNNFYLRINPEIGYRKTENKISQFKMIIHSNYKWQINPKNNIWLTNETGLFQSSNYLTNELFRIGGANSIRGFNEQEIFTQNYNYTNIEYRLRTNTNNYLYSITDIGFLKNNNSNELLLGLGLGYLFRKNTTEIDINLAIGSRKNTPFNPQNTKLIVVWRNYF